MMAAEESSMRCLLLAILAITLALPGAYTGPMGPTDDARRGAGAPSDDVPSLAAPVHALAAPAGPKTSPSPLLHGAIAPPSPWLTPPTSDGLSLSSPDWLPVSSARRHPWLQRFLC